MANRSDRPIDLEAKIRAAIASVPHIGPRLHLRAIRLEDDGVLLDGEVPDIAAKEQALEKVAAIPGVTGIADHLHVSPAVHMSDEEIRVHLSNALIDELSFQGLEIRLREAGNVNLIRGAPLGPRGDIEIDMADGVVTLNGGVPTLTTKRLAGVIAWWVPGVRDVVNAHHEFVLDQIANAPDRVHHLGTLGWISMSNSVTNCVGRIHRSMETVWQIDP